MLGVGSSLIVAWFQSGGDLGLIAWVGLVFGVGQTLESMVLTPLLIGDRIGLHPVMTGCNPIRSPINKGVRTILSSV